MKVKPASQLGRVIVELDRKDEASLAPSSTFQLKQLVVPIDFSDTSHKALRYAVPFAAQFGARQILLHVIEPFALPADRNASDAR